jgi:hypothetical protein
MISTSTRDCTPGRIYGKINEMKITFTRSYGWHNHTSLPCAATQYYSSLYYLRNCSLTKYMLHGITAGKHTAAIRIHNSIQQTELRPANTPPPSAFTTRYSKRPYEPAITQVPTQRFSLLSYNLTAYDTYMFILSQSYSLLCVTSVVCSTHPIPNLRTYFITMFSRSTKA